MLTLRKDSGLYKAVLNAFCCVVSCDNHADPAEICGQLKAVKDFEAPRNYRILMGEDLMSCQFQLIYLDESTETFEIRMGDISLIE